METPIPVEGTGADRLNDRIDDNPVSGRPRQSAQLVSFRDYRRERARRLLADAYAGGGR
jgi:hypothetical protein